jgi:hypothetical protein
MLPGASRGDKGAVDHKEAKRHLTDVHVMPLTGTRSPFHQQSLHLLQVTLSLVEARGPVHL